jgi:hypothetical protein
MPDREEPVVEAWVVLDAALPTDKSSPGPGVAEDPSNRARLDPGPRDEDV